MSILIIEILNRNLETSIFDKKTFTIFEPLIFSDTKTLKYRELPNLLQLENSLLIIF